MSLLRLVGTSQLGFSRRLVPQPQCPPSAPSCRVPPITLYGGHLERPYPPRSSGPIPDTGRGGAPARQPPSGGELRRPMAGPAPAGPSGAPQLTAGAVPDADMIPASKSEGGVRSPREDVRSPGGSVPRCGYRPALDDVGGSPTQSQRRRHRGSSRASPADQCAEPSGTRAARDRCRSGHGKRSRRC